MKSESESDNKSPQVGAAPSHTMLAGVPERELRLLVDGIREWLGSLAHEDCAPGFLGLLEGDPGQGQSEIIDALREVCRGLGIQVLRARTTRDALFPPGAIGDIVTQCLEAFHGAGGVSAGQAQLSADLSAELARLVRGIGLSPCPPLPLLGPDLDRSRLLDAIARSLIELSARNPLLVILEDLESADALTLEALHHLLRLLFLRRRRGSVPRILVIATTAPGADLVSFAGLCDVPARDIEAFRVRARGLSREDLREATTRILGVEGPLSFRERSFRLAGGNARHLKWLLWHVREKGGLQGKVPRLPDTELSFERLVQRRFAHLPERERRLIGVLAALGTHCSSDLPARYAGQRSEGVEAVAEANVSVEALSASGWLTIHAKRDRVDSAPGCDQAGAGATECAICDADVAALVLDALSDTDRMNLHAWLASELPRIAGANAKAVHEERVDSEGERSWLPHAFRQTRLAGDWPACADIGVAATRYLEALGCHDEALGLLDELLESAPREEGFSLAVQIRRAELFCLTQNYREAIDAYNLLLDSTQDKDDRGRFCRLIGDLHGKLRERKLQVKAYDMGLAVTQGEQASLERLKLLAAFARTHLEAQEVDTTLSYLDQCIEVAAQRQLAADSDYPEIYRLAEEVHFHRGDYVEAGEFERCLLKGCEERGNLPGQLQSLQHLAHLHSLRNEREEAEAYLLEAIRLARTSGSRLLLARLLAALGQFKRDQKDVESALKNLRRAHGIFLDFGKAEAAHRSVSIILGMEFERGLFLAAAGSARAFTSGWPLFRDTAIPGLQTSDAADRRARIPRLEKKLLRGGPESGPTGELLGLANLLEEEGRLQEAQKICRECLKREHSGDVLIRASAAFSLGRIATLVGDYDEALKHFELALDTWGTHPRKEILAEAYVEVSLVCLARGELARAFEYGARGVRLALEDGETLGILRSFQCMTAFLTEAGAASAAVALAESFDALAQSSGLPRWELTARRQLVGAITKCKDHSVAVGVTARWLELSSALDVPVENCLMKLELGWDCFQKRNFTEALRLAREGIEIARSVGFEALIDELLHLVGVVESASKNPRKNFLRALDSLEQALQGAEGRKRLRLRWEILQAMAAVYRERQKDDLAEEYQRRADEIELVVLGGLPKTLSAERLCPRARSGIPARFAG